MPVQAESLGTSSSNAFPLIQGDIGAVLRELEGQRRAQSAAGGDEAAGEREDASGQAHEEYSADTGLGVGVLDTRQEGARASWQVVEGRGEQPPAADEESASPQTMHLPAEDTSPVYLSTVTDNRNVHIGSQSLRISATNPIDNTMKGNNPTSRPP